MFKKSSGIPGAAPAPSVNPAMAGMLKSLIGPGMAKDLEAFGGFIRNLDERLKNMETDVALIASHIRESKSAAIAERLSEETGDTSHG